MTKALVYRAIQSDKNKSDITSIQTNTAGLKDGSKKRGYDKKKQSAVINILMRTKTKKEYDKNGDIAKSGKINKTIFDKYWSNFQASDQDQASYDTSDFDISFRIDMKQDSKSSTEMFVFTLDEIFQFDLKNTHR